MLKFGMPTLIETKTVEEAAQVCARLGLHFLELNTNFPQHQLHTLDAQQLKRLAETYKIEYTIHLNDEMPVADFNPIVAEAYCKAVAQSIDFAKIIGAKVINMHLSEGAKYTTPERIILFYEAYQQQYFEGIKRFRDMCTEAVGDSGVCICMENCGGYKPFQKEALSILLESPVFGLTMDIGHNYCAGDVDEAWILEHKDRLQHMHMHDAKNGKNDHLPLGEGVLNIPRYLDLARECDCTVVLETKTLAGLQQSVSWAKQQNLF